ncbi:MAG TPA: aminotransferase class V-fold PLP-dependent enzyme [Chryseolinea sp.]|nr:aminotransferase class V-fold PLP-dependent enzyme [Chryseolinea sp.]
MISFYPGPSRVHDEIPAYVKDAFKKGIMSINHRSDDFVEISKRTITLLHEKLNIPNDYTVFFTSSATECWEIIAQSVVQEKSFHIYNGAFGQKWFDYSKRLHPESVAHSFSFNDKIDPKELAIDQRYGAICLTQNETSNGTQVTNAILRSLKKSSDLLIAVDATSSMAGIRLDFNAADIWFASVQKCFGLPAGLGLLVCSPRAIQHVNNVAERGHYNSITFMSEMMAKWQTPFTPNVLGIYLLMRVLEDSAPIKEVHKKIVERYELWNAFLDERKSIRHLVDTKAVRSYTVLPLTASAEVIQSIKATAKSKGFLLGEGYGDWKPTTFRIANFPAIKKKEIKALMGLLEKF